MKKFKKAAELNRSLCNVIKKDEPKKKRVSTYEL